MNESKTSSELEAIYETGHYRGSDGWLRLHSKLQQHLQPKGAAGAIFNGKISKAPIREVPVPTMDPESNRGMVVQRGMASTDGKTQWLMDSGASGHYGPTGLKLDNKVKTVSYTHLTLPTICSV